MVGPMVKGYFMTGKCGRKAAHLMMAKKYKEGKGREGKGLNSTIPLKACLM